VSVATGGREVLVRVPGQLVNDDPPLLVKALVMRDDARTRCGFGKPCRQRGQVIVARPVAETVSGDMQAVHNDPSMGAAKATHVRRC
jgi:hypothetical protein